MKPVDRGPEDRPRTDSEDLKRLARELSRRLHLQCPQCKDWRVLVAGTTDIKLGSSPDLSEINVEQTSKPRLYFFCTRCRRRIGFVQADEWAASDKEGAEGVSRWDRLELEEDSVPNDKT